MVPISGENRKGGDREDRYGSLPLPRRRGRRGDSGGVAGCADEALGLREWIEDQGHELVTTTAMEDDDELYEHLQDAEVLITTPFWPVYADKEVLDQAPNLRLCI